eukprot:c4263_g1_i2.p1 GENE.c4263_g1_i2~~c4263_g1_i2.p1  ORF type:complete len:171 (+),score=34.18 c4263_g1_i2:709-1221(+)
MPSIIACCAHLHWDCKASFQKQEAVDLRAKLASFPNVTHIVGGDFNCDIRGQAFIKFVEPSQDGGSAYVDLHELTNSCPAFTTHVPRSPATKLPNACRAHDLEYTTLHPIAIDHVFLRVSPDCRLVKTVCLDATDGFTPSPFNGLPNKHLNLGSDHFPVVVDLVLEWNLD